MSKRFVHSINYLRGLCMLGVIAIHIGSVALTNPTPNLGLIAVLEILSRFSVPAFFFLSAFGLFYKYPLQGPFSYTTYLKRRLKTVFIPYLFWSLFYLCYMSVAEHSYTLFRPLTLGKTLLFGLSMYHIYFLVILLWFYLLMPLWRYLLKKTDRHASIFFPLLFIGNVIFNYYSSYVWIAPPTSLWHDLFVYRLNYLVLHYIFIFFFGAFTAEHFPAVIAWMKNHAVFLYLFQGAAVLAMLGSYAGVMHYWQYSALSAVFTIHQLSPIGMIYTVSTLLFFLYQWECRSLSPVCQRLFTLLGNVSYPMYLVHPVWLSIGAAYLHHRHLVPDAAYILCLYLFVTLTSLLYSLLIQKISLPSWLQICLGIK
ncbi:acyltransferase [Megasphaera lornae]|uniref:Acyltransferase n=1 Tax=Megasphaera lornae TaxID=1000568 RepID=A0ABN0CZD5_9FIRM|nr:acyltransferase [Megasphaera lornae]EGL39612.1 acyltransferase [Megasphaera lornae]